MSRLTFSDVRQSDGVPRTAYFRGAPRVLAQRTCTCLPPGAISGSRSQDDGCRPWPAPQAPPPDMDYALLTSCLCQIWCSLAPVLVLSCTRTGATEHIRSFSSLVLSSL